MAVAALDRHDDRDTRPVRRQDGRPAGRVAVLGMDEVEGLACVFGRDGRHHGIDVTLEIAVGLFADLLESDHPEAGDRRRRTAAVDLCAEGIAPVLADHRHVVAGADEFAEQVRGIDAHAGDRRKEASAEEADPHATHSRSYTWIA